jgi:hypothetical protein
MIPASTPASGASVSPRNAGPSGSKMMGPDKPVHRTTPEEPLLVKNLIFAVLQFVLFFLVFAVFSFLPPFHLMRIVSTSPQGTHIFIFDGLLLSAALLVLILLIEALRKRIRTAGVWTVGAFALAVASGLAIKLGFMSL